MSELDDFADLERLEAEVDRFRAYLADQYQRVVDVHAHVVMDTAEDRELHDRAIATFREALAPVTAHLAAVAGHPAGQQEVGA